MTDVMSHSINSMNALLGLENVDRIIKADRVLEPR